MGSGLWLALKYYRGLQSLITFPTPSWKQMFRSRRFQEVVRTVQVGRVKAYTHTHGRTHAHTHARTHAARHNKSLLLALTAHCWPEIMFSRAVPTSLPEYRRPLDARTLHPLCFWNNGLAIIISCFIRANKNSRFYLPTISEEAL